MDTYEIGFDHIGKRFSMGLTYYYSDADGFVDYMDLNADLDGDTVNDKMATNVGKVEIQGVEFEADAQYTKTTKVYFNTSWTAAKYKEYPDAQYVGKNLTDRPETVGNLGMAYNRPGDESYSLNLGYVGARYEYYLNKGVLEVYRKRSYYSADISAAKWLEDDVRLNLNVRNIFKPRYVITSSSEGMYQQPGVIWNLGVEYEF
ncbi:MAG: TonB-dependent receptor [bacterium]